MRRATATRCSASGIRRPSRAQPLDLRPLGAYSLRGHSIGGFGSVTTNRLVASLAGELFDLRVQAYPRYGSEKKGLPTTYYLTIADEPIHEHGELETVDMVAIYDVAAFRQGDPLHGLVDGGTLFVETALSGAEAVWAALPAEARAEILARRISVWSLDTAGLARANAPRADLEVRMQGVALVGVFLRVSPFAARAGLHRDALLAAVGRSPGPLLRQARPACGGGQPGGDQRRVRQRPERDCSDRGGPSAGLAGDAAVGGHHMTAEAGLGAERQ